MRCLPGGTDTFREVSGQLMSEGYAVRFRVAGTSMAPAIDDGDLITVARVAVGEIAPGDVVFYACGRRTIAHRVVDIRSTASSMPTFIVRGDAKGGCDAPVAASQILGKVVAVQRANPRRFWKTWRRRLQTLLFIVGGRGGGPQPAGAAAQDPPAV